MQGHKTRTENQKCFAYKKYSAMKLCNYLMLITFSTKIRLITEIIKNHFVMKFTLIKIMFISYKIKL